MKKNKFTESQIIKAIKEAESGRPVAEVSRELLQMVVEHRQTFFRYNTLDYAGILNNGVQVVPPKESWADWRSDYSRTTVMIYNDIPSFDDLMQFVAHLEKEFNEWVSNK